MKEDVARAPLLVAEEAAARVQRVMSLPDSAGALTTLQLRLVELVIADVVRDERRRVRKLAFAMANSIDG